MDQLLELVLDRYNLVLGGTNSCESLAPGRRLQLENCVSSLQLVIVIHTSQLPRQLDWALTPPPSARILRVKCASGDLEVAHHPRFLTRMIAEALDCRRLTWDLDLGVKAMTCSQISSLGERVAGLDPDTDFVNAVRLEWDGFSIAASPLHACVVLSHSVTGPIARILVAPHLKVFTTA